MLWALLLAGHVLALRLLGSRGSQAPVDRDLAFTGSFTGSSAYNLATGDVHAVSTGDASHFGISNLEQHAQIALIGPSTLSLAGTWTLTAANGDQLSGTAVGTGNLIDATRIALRIDYTATGGTGRFADASATFTVTVRHARTAFENGISYGEHQATLDGRLGWHRRRPRAGMR